MNKNIQGDFQVCISVPLSKMIVRQRIVPNFLEKGEINTKTNPFFVESS